MAVKKLDDQAIFEVARRIGSSEARQAYLAQICGDDPATAERIAALLQANDESASFLESPPPGIVASLTIGQPVQEGPGTQIGPYKLLQQIGEGGFGVVFMAEQLEPIRRRVALKVIKPGMDTRQVIARFEAERQALAVMDHPNIARVMDAGATDSSRPYFVMELVRGVPITSYCDDNSLPVRERLDLFAFVCQAIQHAHTKGIIHRDIKPSNVLVTRQDGQPVVKVIDFGIAKALGQQLTDKTLFTDFAQMIGTPLYMSPEQAERAGTDVDTRSDIYSLGVLLYELLTGSTPVSKQQLQHAAFDEIRRIIREDEAQMPSNRISTAEAAPSIAAQRHTEPAKLTKLVRGELDWIVMKSLEKDRNRRYETANAFALDVQRYLNDEQVQACPPSAAYRFRKFARRNKAALVPIALVAITLVAATAFSAWQAIRATRAETLAIKERDDKERARRAEENERKLAVGERNRAVKAEVEAKYQAAISQAISRFLQNDLLALASPWSEPERDLKLRTVLDRAGQDIEGKFSQQPLVEASIRETIGTAYLQLDLMAEAQKHLERAQELRWRHQGEGHRAALATTNQLALTLRIQGKLAEAEAVWRRSLELGSRELGDDDPEMAETRHHLGYVLQRQGKLADAEPLYETAFAVHRRVFGEEDPRTLESLSRLTLILHAQGKQSPAEAEATIRRVLESQRRLRGNEHPDTLVAMQHLAALLREQYQLDEAEQLSREGLAIGRRVFGDEHGHTLGLMKGLGAVLRTRGDFVGAESLLVKSVEGYSRKRVRGHYLTLGVMRDLVELYDAWGRPDEAAKWRKALEVGNTSTSGEPTQK